MPTLADIQRQIQEIATDRNALLQANQQDVGTVNKLIARVQTRQSEIMSLHSQINDLNQQLSGVTSASQVEALQSQRASLQNQVAQKRSQIEADLQQVETVRGRIDGRLDDIEVLTQELNGLRAQLQG